MQRALTIPASPGTFVIKIGKERARCRLNRSAGESSPASISTSTATVLPYSVVAAVNQTNTADDDDTSRNLRAFLQTQPASKRSP
jgi:hypothetical protein